jgi:hypothetical protein
MMMMTIRHRDGKDHRLLCGLSNFKREDITDEKRYIYTYIYIYTHDDSGMKSNMENVTDN